MAFRQMNTKDHTEDGVNQGRRSVLGVLTAVCLLCFPVSAALAKDGDSGGDSGGSNSGSGNSGSGSDDHDGDDDESEDDNAGDDDNDHDNARDAVRKGSVVSLSRALVLLKKAEPGRVIQVKLVELHSGFEYRFKVVTGAGKVKTIKMNAATGRIAGN